jgi:hypothetical protein
MRTRSLLFGLLALPVVVFADASDGQFMGYELGTNYATTPKHIERTTLGDVVIVADDPLKPADIQEVKLFATAVSRTIGYISAASWYATESEAREVARHYAELLRVKYPDWEFGREAMDAISTRPHTTCGCAWCAMNMKAAICGASPWASVGNPILTNGRHGKTFPLPNDLRQWRPSASRFWKTPMCAGYSADRNLYRSYCSGGGRRRDVGDHD